MGDLAGPVGPAVFERSMVYARGHNSKVKKSLCVLSTTMKPPWEPQHFMSIVPFLAVNMLRGSIIDNLKGVEKSVKT